MGIERVQPASTQFENVNGRTLRTSPTLNPKPCSLTRWTCSIRIQHNDAWEGIIKMLVSVQQTRYNDDCKSLTPTQ